MLSMNKSQTPEGQTLAAPIKSFDMLDYLETDATQFVTDDSHCGFLVVDTDTVEGYESSTVISLFGQKIGFDSSVSAKEFMHERKQNQYLMQFFEKSEQNLLARAIADLVVIDEEGDEKTLEMEDLWKGI